MNQGLDEKELLARGYKKYTGESIDVFFNLDICQHSANCTMGHPEVFNIKRKPWILIENGQAGDIARVIDNCPSCALQYILKENQ